MSTNTLTSEFGPIRSFLWPIYRHEARKIVPMLAMLFLICFVQSVLRNMKDAVVVTASGAEVIPFIKVWVMFPTAVLFTYFFTKLCNWFSQEKVFYIVISGFLSFFALFAFVLYPLRESLHLVTLAHTLEGILPIGFKGLIEMCRNWSFTLFYVMSELWGSVVLSVLFWGFANEVTKMGEAQRFYSVLGIGANFAAFMAGQAGVLFAHQGDAAWDKTVFELVTLVLLSGVGSMAIFRWMSKQVLTDKSFDEFHHAKKMAKKKKKLSFKESFSYLSNSKYLVCIAVVVLSYNLVINLVEIVWKDQLRLLYSSPSDYNRYMNHLTSWIGIFSTITAFFMARIIEKFGWTKTALITPVIMMVTCAGFFSFFLFQDSLSGIMLSLTGLSPLAVAVFFGGAQNCLSKASKYSVFDATKEMSFIPLDHETKLKGKAAIDGVGSRLGKSGGSFIHQGLLLIFGSISVSAPIVAVIILTVIGFWIVATKSLGGQFETLAHQARLAEEIKEEQSKKEQDKEEPLETAPLLA